MSLKAGQVRNIGVIGAGLMGHGIAQAFAVNGYKVNIFDADTKVLETLPDRIRKNLQAFLTLKMIKKSEIEKCIGCGACVDECPFTPSRPIVAADERYEGDHKARKCELCADARFHWDAKGGGPQGKQACVEVCPVGAIQFTTKVPEQEGDAGYHVDLRNFMWGSLGYPTD